MWLCLVLALAYRWYCRINVSLGAWNPVCPGREKSLVTKDWRIFPEPQPSAEVQDFIRLLSVSCFHTVCQKDNALPSLYINSSNRVESLSLEKLKTQLDMTEQPAIRDPALSSTLDKTTSRGPLPPPPARDSSVRNSFSFLERESSFFICWVKVEIPYCQTKLTLI